MQPQAPAQVQPPADGDQSGPPKAPPGPVKIPSPVLLAFPHRNLATFGLEFLSASGVETGALLPAELQCIYLKSNPSSPADGNGMSTFAIGRIHQQKVFEAWVPDQALQCCISRTAFEVVCDAQGGAASLIVRGQGPVSVDGKVAQRETPVPLHPRSEILFAHGAEGIVILRLRYLPASELSLDEKVSQVSVVSEAKVCEVEEPKEPKEPKEPSSPPPRRIVRKVDEEKQETGMTGESAPDLKSPSARQWSSWMLACTHVEGLTPGQLADLRSAVRDIHVSQMPMMLGRLHQNQFEALVTAAEKPKFASFISRTHGKLEADPDGTALLLTNVSPSNNPSLSSTSSPVPKSPSRLDVSHE